MKSIAVYCGANVGNDDSIVNASKELMKSMADQNMALVYGAGNVGLMGVIANEMLALGGKVIGVVPTFLTDLEVHHKNLTEIHIVETMHIRKTIMADLSDGFIAMPGGFGTLDEIFEILCWRQLQLHTKPVGFLNINGFYDHIFAHADHMVKTGFLKPENRAFMLIDDNPTSLLAQMEAFRGVTTTKWIK